MLKIDTLFYIGDNYYVKANSGLPTWQVMSICGTDADGNDVSNELSEIILDAGYEMRLSNLPLAVRYSPKTSRKVIDKAMRLVQAGTGNPAFFSDDVAMEIVRRKGADNEEAHDWSIHGCIEPHPGGGHSDGSPVGGYVSLPKIMEVTLHNGVDPVTGLEVGLKTGNPGDFRSMDALVRAFEKQMYRFIDLHTTAMNATMSVQAHYLPCIYSSIFVDDCIRVGKTIQEGGSRHKYINFFLAGCATLADSLAAIDYAVFQEKKLSMDALIHACDTDFANQEPLRQYLINKAPKFGNDLGYVDSQIADIQRKGCEYAQKLADHRGGWFSCGNMSQTHNVALGGMVGATPDGRKAFTFFSDNGSPMNGRDVNGPTAAANSVASMPHASNFGGTLYNIRFDSQTVAGEKGRRIIEGVFTNFCESGGYHIQANVMDDEVLLAAQKNPENYRDLVIRVSGYLAYFTELDRTVQDSIIGRSTHLAGQRSGVI
jgi:formate C-acetyltransferase